MSRIVFVSGGNSGIGKAIAERFVKENDKVIIAARRKEEGERVAKELTAMGPGTCIFIQTDVADQNQVNACFQQIKKLYGRLDVAVNNSGMESKRQRLHKKKIEDIKQVLDVNILGVILCMQQELEFMVPQRSGCSSAFIAEYIASKHAVWGLTKSCASEYGERNIRCNMIAPTFIDTGFVEDVVMNHHLVRWQHPLQHRLGVPHDVSGTAIFLASKDAAYITGQSIAVDGGYLASNNLPIELVNMGIHPPTALPPVTSTTAAKL